MISSLESFSNELLYEIFGYISPYDLFRSFFHLNNRFNTIVSSYPLHLNFRSISRLEFDYICYHLQPKQVISLLFSDEIIPRQLHIFKKYFPLFKQQFLHLQSIILIGIFDEKIDLPESVQFVEIRKYDIYQNFGFNFDSFLEQQAKVLTHLKIDRIGTLNYIHTPFPRLKYLIIDGGFSPNVDCYVKWTNQYKNVNATSIFQRLKSSITHLYLFIDKENRNMKINLEPFTHCLTHLTLHFVEDMIVSFQTIKQCLNNIHQLTHLTLQATGQNDLANGNQWKIFILKTNIIKFNFKFQILNQDQPLLLESFRSSFWIEEKHCYVGHHYNEEDHQTFLYTIPRFRFKNIMYPSSNIPYRTTASSNLEEHFLYKNKIDSLLIDIDNFTVPPIHRFTQVKSLILHGSVLMSLDNLKNNNEFKSNRNTRYCEY